MQEKITSFPSRRFGRTELNIPILSLGGMRFQQSWTDMDMEQISEEWQQNLEEILEFSVKNGLHHVETARHYGTSELQLGCGMQQIPDLKRILQTKIPPREDPSQFESELELSFLNSKRFDNPKSIILMLLFFLFSLSISETFFLGSIIQI